MFVTVVAVMCYVVASTTQTFTGRDCTAEEAEVEEIVTDSNMTEGLDFFGCVSGWAIPVSKWKTEHSLYHSDRWRVARVKCVQGKYEPKGRA